MLRQQLDASSRAAHDRGRGRELDAKTATENKKLNSGTITAPRIEALSDEIDGLGRRKRAIEDDEIGSWRRPSRPGDVARLDGEHAAGGVEITRLRQAIADQESTIDAEIDQERDRSAP